MVYHFKALHKGGSRGPVAWGFNYSPEMAKEFLTVLRRGAPAVLFNDADVPGYLETTLRQEDLVALDIVRADGHAPLGMDEDERKREFALATAVAERDVLEPEEAKAVFIVHGRNAQVLARVVEFIEGLGLNSITWENARARTGKATPYVLEIAEAGMRDAQAFVVVMTAEDRAGLLPELARDENDRADTQLRGQPRENVLLEAGMAIARAPDRTILVSVGAVRFPSDLLGLYPVDLDNSATSRRELAERLRTAGCLIRPADDWLSRGRLQEGDIKSVPPLLASPSDL